MKDGNSSITTLPIPDNNLDMILYITINFMVYRHPGLDQVFSYNYYKKKSGVSGFCLCSLLRS